MRLSGKVALVTGGGRGIGRAISLRLAVEGASVAIADIDLDAARLCSDEIKELGRQSVAIELDTSNRSNIANVLASVIDSFGHLDIAFNNAGVGHNAPFLEITEADWDRMFRVNAKGVFLCVQGEARQMIKQGTGGKIINTASIAGRHGSPFQAHYSASKFAVIGITQSAAKALAPHGITVNALNPGIIDTAMWRNTDSELSSIYLAEQGKTMKSGQVTEEIRKNIPLQRIGAPEDVASLALFLASADSDYMTGQAINVCGGLIMD